MTNQQPRYSVLIQWSDEDQKYVVSFPEWGTPHTDGSTYEEAARNAQEVLELLMQDTDHLPEPRLFSPVGEESITA